MADDAAPASRDYRETVFLPDTPFPMRAGLPQKEPVILEQWKDADLYNAIRKVRQAADAPLFVLHDGPPYANGAIHIGHALNKILKDFVVRSRFALGYDVDYVPGWDCHGLPIEWKIEEKYRAKGQRKDEVPVAEFRPECREYAAHWISEQMREFQRLGVLGDWDAPLRDDGLRQRSRDRQRVPQVRDLRPALPRVEAGDVEPGGAHGAGRRRGRVPRPHLADDLGEVPGDRGRRRGRRRERGDLDHDALDHPGQPGGQLQSRHRLRPLCGRRAGRGSGVRALGRAGRPLDPGRQPGRRRHGRRQGRQIPPHPATSLAKGWCWPTRWRRWTRAMASRCRCCRATT